MGSKPRDSQEMSTASAGANAASQAQANLANQQSAYGKQFHDQLFGTDGHSGTLTPFMDPAKLEAVGPQGVYADQYKAAVGQNAKAGQNVLAQVNRNLASRGFGNAPSGFAADEARKTMLDTADANQGAYLDQAGKSHNEALSNFWDATNLASGNAATATNAAIQANSSAAGTYANLYNTASTPQPSALGSIVGGGLQAGGQIGAAAMMCPAAGSKIRLLDGTDKLAEELQQGDVLLGIDGEGCEILIQPSARNVWTVTTTLNGGAQSTTSQSHAWVRAKGGYVEAQHGSGATVALDGGSALIESVADAGYRDVFPLTLSGSNSYLCDGIWSLS